MSGRLTIHLRDRDIDCGRKIFIIHHGVEHCPDAEDETEVLLVEQQEYVDAGDAGGDMTAEPGLL